MKVIRWIVIFSYLFLAVLPLVWMGLTSIKSRDDTISTAPKFIPATHEPQNASGPVFAATSHAFHQLADLFFHYLFNSILIGVCSTVASVALGTASAYGFSRFK